MERRAEETQRRPRVTETGAQKPAQRHRIASDHFAVDQHPADASAGGRRRCRAGLSQTSKDCRPMNRKQLLRTVVVGLVLGGIGLYVNRQNSASFQRGQRTAGERLLGEFPINDVAQITLRQYTNQVNLVKAADLWTVKERDGYPANMEDIIEFARKLWDLKPAQTQKIGETQLGRLELLAPDKGGTNSGTLVELKGKEGNLIKAVTLGKKSMRDSVDSSFGGGGGG